MSIAFLIEQAVDLRRANPVLRYEQQMETGDAGAHRWTVTIRDGGNAAALAGMSAKCLITRAASAAEKAMGKSIVTVMQKAEVDVVGGTVSCLLNAECYAGTGAVAGVMRLADGHGGVTVVAKMTAQLGRNTSDTLSDPENLVPSVDALLAMTEAIEAATQEAENAAQEAHRAAQSASFTILDVYETAEQLSAAHPTGEAGEAYGVGMQAPYDVYIWGSDTGAWRPVGKLQAAPIEHTINGQHADANYNFVLRAEDVGAQPADAKVVIRPLVSIKTQDCILIQAGGKNILCDTGTLSAEEDPDAPAVLLGKLRALGVEHIDMICISHYHSDHTGLPELVAAGLDMTGATLILPQTPDFAVVGSGVSKQYADIINLVETHGLTVKIPTEKERILLDGDDTYFEFYNTDHTAYYAMADFDYNNCSLCVMLVHGNKRVFFSGDLAMAGQAALVGTVPKVDLYKLEHHGLNAKFNTDYYATLTPSMCFTSNGWGDAGRTSTYIHSRSAVQAYLERMGVPNYCTHDNENLCFIVGRDSIEVQGRSFNKPTNIVNHTSMMSAVDADYSSVATVKAMSFKELCLGMKPDSHLVTQIDSDFAMWEMVSPFVSGSISSATLDIYKVSSSDIRGALDVITGYFHIYPRSTDSFTVGMLFGSFYYNPNASTPTFGATIKQLNPSQVHYFKWNQEALMFEPETYSGKAFTVNENGEILSTYSGLAKIWVTVTNNGSEDKVYSLEDSANSGSNRVRATAKCAAGCTASMAHMESVSASSILAIKADGASLSSDDDVRVMIESMNRYQSHYLYTEEDVTGGMIESENDD